MLWYKTIELKVFYTIVIITNSIIYNNLLIINFLKKDSSVINHCLYNVSIIRYITKLFIIF